MQFVSTRGQAPALGFSDAVLDGTGARRRPLRARDLAAGRRRARSQRFADTPYAEIAARHHRALRRRRDRPRDALDELIDEAYADLPPSRRSTPLVEIGPATSCSSCSTARRWPSRTWPCSSWRGMMDHVLLEQRGKRATIVGATSGDTGSAAIEAFRGRDNIDIFILHPEGRTSAVQRRQMTTVLDANVHNIALEGTFDDCQALREGLFTNAALPRRHRRSPRVNSINWGRIVAQIVYYFTAAAPLGAPHRAGLASPSRPAISATSSPAMRAQRMGLPIERLVDRHQHQRHPRPHPRDRPLRDRAASTPTISPSMDIQVSSNFERLLFEATGRDGDGRQRPDAGPHAVRRLHHPRTARSPRIRADLRRRPAPTRPRPRRPSPTTLERRRLSARSRTPPSASPSPARQLGGDAPMVTLATAHPAKFPAAVKAATGIEPALPAVVG